MPDEVAFFGASAMRPVDSSMIDLRGHDSIIDRNFWADLAMGRTSAEARERIMSAWGTGTRLTEPVRVTSTCSHLRCGRCHADAWETDGFRAWAAEPCPHPDGFLLEVELEVPSGRILFANDLRRWWPVDDEAFDVNTDLGIAQTVEAYAEAGMLHFFVGNSSPSVYRTADETFAIATPGYTENDVEIPFDGENLGSIFTGLWWVCAVDAADARRRGVVEHDGIKVPVRPGTYTLTYRRLEADFDRDWRTPTVYATLAPRR